MTRMATIPAVFFLALLYSVSFVSVTDLRSISENRNAKAVSFRMPPVVIKFIAGEFKGLFADYALIEAASIVGKREKIKPEEWETIAFLLNQSVELDPYFAQTLFLTHGSLPWHTSMYDKSQAILIKSKEHRFWDWIPGYFVGFDYFYFLKDNEKAAKYLMEASEVEGAPVVLAAFAAKLSQRAGQTLAAIRFLKAYYQKEEDEDNRKVINERIEALTGVYIIEKAIAAFQEKYGNKPEELKLLVETGMLSEMPNNPYGKEFTYDMDENTVQY